MVVISQYMFSASGLRLMRNERLRLMGVVLDESRGWSLVVGVKTTAKQQVEVRAATEREEGAPVL